MKLSLPGNAKFMGIISELLGHLGSSEGCPYILRSVGAANSNVLDLKVIIPAFFGTAVVPVSLDGPVPRIIVACLCPKLVLVKNLPFSSLQLPPPHDATYRGLPAGHRFMEFYDAFQLVMEGASGTAPQPRVQSSEWFVHQRWRLWGFGLYLFFGDKREGPFLTSDVSQPQPAGSNWCNLFVPIGDPVQCVGGDTIALRCTSYTCDALEPHYRFEVSLLRGRRVVYEKTVEFQYRDIILPMYKYKDLTMPRKRKGIQ